MKIKKTKEGISVLAPAKINLFLEVLGKRPDGYHELATVMQEVSLADELEIKEAPEGVKLICTDSSIPSDSRNLAWRAAELFKKERGIKKGVEIYLRKQVPWGAGLGGGSSDAAAVLKGLDILWNLNLGDEELIRMGTKLGSDVPFFVKGNTALCRGRGELVTPISSPGNFAYVLVYPELRVMTERVYKNLKFDLTKKFRDVTFFLAALATYNPEEIGKSLFNRLEESALSLYPELGRLKDILIGLDFCGVSLSGSGSTIYGLCRRYTDAQKITQQLKGLGIGRVYTVTNTCSFEVT